MDEALGVREFWFGHERVTAETLSRRMRMWFSEDLPEERARRDAEITTRFAKLFERAASGELDTWADGPRRRLSLIILLDQFPRHMFRGTARAFACDDKALGLTLSGMQSAADAALDVRERLFFYMPL
jgi:uncharacterized protein (DUF924 family)